ncbi:uncharacterized protein CcaverHIS019_0705160 [Cutaneotrichosporon cavernicola]|uniref:Protein arginine methyltransferase NDUFAF7 n=1 Tax=Cutaneotrichosporon cavernicola TaxID=279322 RepID=A0AA48QZ45_9TREE|nr:uncharacterized protein CcaverHIS019_0705160 [Cutaneotrichosporon cavernicola]BEI94935.1 hypothetical protein CcaverHIS019_0705160 [Cutaneotrichosporon cavernicola]
MSINVRRSLKLAGSFARGCSRQQNLRPLSTLPEKGLVGATTQPQSLAQVIDDSIKATGPMSVARYMQLCLTHPNWGYYSQGDVFGREGDFITSPEISQVFGELVAIWLLTRWMAAGAPERVRLLELGPGRGTLMDDVLRALAKFKIDSVTLVEYSEKMRGIQQEKLGPRCEALGAKLVFEEEIAGVKESPLFTMFIAHEFFDAMPVHVFQRDEAGFREVRVDRNPSYLPAANNPRFRLGVDRESSLLASLLPASSARFGRLPIGARVEICPDSSRIMRSVGEAMAEGGGAGLVIDYGSDRSFSNSVRGFRKHKVVDLFEEPGTADLTANVDFAYLKESLDGVAETAGPITQAKFLLSLGLEPRLAKLISSAADPTQRKRIEDGAKRLIDKTGMGTQYQVMAVVKGPAGEDDVYPFGKPSKDVPEAPKLEEKSKS